MIPLNIIEKYTIARWAYAIGEDFISDVEYDRIEQELKANNMAHEYTSRGWSEDPCPFELLDKYNLTDFNVKLIHSHATESIASLNSDDLVERELSFLKEKSRLSYKLDGFSIRLHYFNGKLVYAASRNRNDGKAMKLSSVFKLFPQTITQQGKVFIAGELYLKNSMFEEYKRLRGITSQRNGVSTAIANGDVEFLGYRCYSIYSSELAEDNYDKYRVLQELGFPVPKFIFVIDYNSLLKGLDILGRQKDSYDAPTDGVVIENSTQQFALRIKAWKEECNGSYITGYVLNRGMYGDSILVSIKPVFLGNKTVNEVVVTNLQTIIDNDLRIGSPIAFVERSAVNSVLDTTKTKELQLEYAGRYDEYISEVNSVLNAL